MNLILIGHKFQFEMENIIRLFFPFEKISINSDSSNFKVVIVTKIIDNTNGDKTVLSVKITTDSNMWSKQEEISKNIEKYDKTCERTLAALLYNELVNMTKYKNKWGSLTGVRPIKLLRKTVQEHKSIESASDWMMKNFKVSSDKIALSKEIFNIQEKMIDKALPSSISLYISIPFCPSRCSYCSFVSHSIDSAGKLLPKYIELLCEELKVTASIVKQLNLTLDTIYIGGGTPTILDKDQLYTLLDTIESNFDISRVYEFSIEAGRPDTIDIDKLNIIKQGNINRISINPQSLQNDVLKAIGRNHTVNDFYNSFEIARKVGFDNINCDLIAGLPNDSVSGFSNSLSKLLELAPEGITVHALAIKKSSKLSDVSVIDRSGRATQMISHSIERLKNNNYMPYYLYKQSRCVDNMENTGWAKPSNECYYNVFMMEEIHTVIGCGAGSVTKLKQQGLSLKQENIHRIFNYKFPYEYIYKFENIIERKYKAKNWLTKHM